MKEYTFILKNMTKSENPILPRSSKMKEPVIEINTEDIPAQKRAE